MISDLHAAVARFVVAEAAAMQNRAAVQALFELAASTACLVEALPPWHRPVPWWPRRYTRRQRKAATARWRRCEASRVRAAAWNLAAAVKHAEATGLFAAAAVAPGDGTGGVP